MCSSRATVGFSCPAKPPTTTSKTSNPTCGGTVAGVFPHLTVASDEYLELVAQGILEAEEIRREAPLGGYRQALAAGLANRLRNYYDREMHKEVRRNTRAKAKAAAAGEIYEVKTFSATGLALEHGNVDGDLDHEIMLSAPEQTDAAAQRNLLLAALANASSPEIFTTDPQAVGALLGVASYGTLGKVSAKKAFEAVHEMREQAADFTFVDANKLI